MPTDTPPGSPDHRPGDDAAPGDGTVAGAESRPRSRVTGVGKLRQRPPAWIALLTGAFAVGVFAATDGVLRLLAEPAPASAPPSTSAPPSAPAGASPEGGTSTTSQPPGGPAAAGATPAPPSPAAGAVNDSADEDTNVDEAAEGPRRATPAKPSEDEAPEYRESADNNISLPVDI
jgi:hypothetical protein